MSNSVSPGGAVGIAFGASAVTLLIAGGIYYGTRVPFTYESGPRTSGFLDSFSLVNWFKVLYYFLPYGLFLFGVIYDGLVRRIKFFPAGFVGLAIMAITRMITGATTGGITDKDICGVPGMSGWGSDIAPQNIVFTTTVLSYLASYISASQSDSSYSGSAWAGVFSVWILQAYRFYKDDCNLSHRWWFTGGDATWSKFVPSFIGLLLGMLVGGLSGYGFSNLQGDSAGVGISSEAKQSLGKTGGPAMAPTSDTAGAGKCSPTGDDDQFVCEAYKNGELVTSTIVE